MEVNPQNLTALCGQLQKTLSPQIQQRQEAEKFLREIEGKANFSHLLVKVMDSEQVGLEIRQAAAVYFKNYIMRNWVPDNPDKDLINQQDRALIKKHLAELMLRSPKLVQTQLSHALAIVSKADFPKNWPELLPQLVARMGEENFGILHGVLETAHSIFHRYRIEIPDEEMVEELLYVLKGFCGPLLQLFERITGLLQPNMQNKAMLAQLLEVLHMIIEIVHDLNAAEHPEFFTDTLKQWMDAFSNLLRIPGDVLEHKSEDEPGPVERVKESICSVVHLFITKYESDFEQYTAPFVQQICMLITTLDDKERNDQLVATAIKCLTQACGKKATHAFFAQTLDTICSKIIVPQIKMRDSDEELFEMNGLEYVRRDMEGSDVDTRRRTVVDFIRALVAAFPKEITHLLQGYVERLLAQNAQDPDRNWKYKDSALYIFLALSVQGATREKGATKTNPFLDLGKFIPEHILKELSEGKIDDRPVIKADCLKFLSTFRQHLPKEDIPTKYLPLLIRYLAVEEYPVHTYAALAIEQFLALTVDSPELGRDGKPKKQNLVRPEQVQVLIQQFKLLDNIFSAMKHPDSAENPNIMKAVLRVCATGKETMAAYDSAFLGKLSEILQSVVRNPQNPEFGHYLFETYACLVKYICHADPERVGKFEAALFGPFQKILSPVDEQGNPNPVYCQDFHTYVFQILAQMLEIRKDVPPPYRQIFRGLLTPAMYESDGDVPGMVRLLRLMLRKDPEFCIGEPSSNRLTGILGVFRFLNGSRKHDHHGIGLITDVFVSVPKERLDPHLKTVFELILTRLQRNRRTAKYVEHILPYFGVLVVKFGMQTVAEWVDRNGNNVFHMILEKVWIENLHMVQNPLNRKKVAVGMSHLLCRSPLMLQPPYVQLWIPMLQALVEFLETPRKVEAEEEDFMSISEQGFKTVYAPLVFARGANLDPFANVPEPKEHLAKALGELDQRFPGKLGPMLQKLNPAAQKPLLEYLNKAGVRIA